LLPEYGSARSATLSLLAGHIQFRGKNGYV
jgi:hypothetical protein